MPFGGHAIMPFTTSYAYDTLNGQQISATEKLDILKEIALLTRRFKVNFYCCVTLTYERREFNCVYVRKDKEQRMC